eukprot:scaffold104096_cov63-Phaeocystis_antarctica.AAC.1
MILLENVSGFSSLSSPWWMISSAVMTRTHSTPNSAQLDSSLFRMSRLGKFGSTLNRPGPTSAMQMVAPRNASDGS